MYLFNEKIYVNVRPFNSAVLQLYFQLASFCSALSGIPTYTVGTLQHPFPIVLNYCISERKKNHIFNWFNTLHVTFNIPGYRLGC